MNGSLTVVSVCRHCHPISSSWVARLSSLVTQASGESGAQVANIGDHQIRFALLDDDAPWQVAGARMRLEFQPKHIGPAILFDQKVALTYGEGSVAPNRPQTAFWNPRSAQLAAIALHRTIAATVARP